MCEIRPPVTVWGTTQIKTFTTILSTIASDQISTITRETIVTNVIPVETRSYPCSSTSAASPSSTPTPTLSPSTEPRPTSPIQTQPNTTSEVTEQPTTTQTQPASSSEEEPSFRVTREETDPVTTSRLSRTSLQTTTTDRQSSNEVETTESPAKPTPDPLNSETEPVLSASILFTDSDTTATTAGASLSSSSSHSSSLPVGAIIGIILGVVLILTLLGFFIWTRKNKKDRDSGDGDPYWERRFQELESVQSQSKARFESSTDSPSGPDGTWRRHLTLNLGSHHPIINRPASRLSQISSFFGNNQNHTFNQQSPPPSRLGLMAETPRERDEIDFSQPADKWSIATRARPASTRSKRSQTASRKSTSIKSDLTERRSSAWPFNAIAAAIRPRVEGGSRNGSIEGRRGMEWIRTIVSSDSGFGFNLDPNRDRDRDQGTRGLPPPPRKGVSPMPLKNPVLIAKGKQCDDGEDQEIDTTNPIPQNQPPSYFPQSLPYLSGDEVENDRPRQLYPSKTSLRRKRVDKGLAVPDLALARDAVSPNLWVDEDTLDRNDSTIPAPSVAPLAIAKRAIVTGTNINKTGPSAYDPDLISRFSPDSSRGSFTTDGRQSIPAAPQVEPQRRSGPPQKDTDTDSIATRRYDRSAVTPQLPTLSFSGEAFKADMAEFSATGGEDREERVISFHGGKEQDRYQW